MFQAWGVDHHATKSPGGLRCEVFLGDRSGDLHLTSVPFSISNIQQGISNKEIVVALQHYFKAFSFP